jgi:serine/threonine protein kinase
METTRREFLENLEGWRLRDYRLGQRLGSGGQGVAYKATHVFTEVSYVVKVSDDCDRLKRELRGSSQVTIPGGRRLGLHVESGRLTRPLEHAGTNDDLDPANGSSQSLEATDPTGGRADTTFVPAPTMSSDEAGLATASDSSDPIQVLPHAHTGNSQECFVHYLVMEFVAGTSLDAEAHDGRHCRLSHALRIARDVAKTVSSVHEKFVHCDIAPKNVRRMPDGSYMLLDFGSCWFSGDGVTEPSGTPLYLSPERANEFLQGTNSPQPTVDVFALGMTLYELVTGKHPYRKELTGKELRLQYEWIAKPSHAVSLELTDLSTEDRTELGQEFVDLVNDCLKPAPTARPQSLGEVLNKVESMLQSVDGQRSNMDAASRKPRTRRLELRIPSQSKSAWTDRSVEIDDRKLEDQRESLKSSRDGHHPRSNRSLIGGLVFVLTLSYAVFVGVDQVFELRRPQSDPGATIRPDRADAEQHSADGTALSAIDTPEDPSELLQDVYTVSDDPDHPDSQLIQSVRDDGLQAKRHPTQPGLVAAGAGGLYFLDPQTGEVRVTRSVGRPAIAEGVVLDMAGTDARSFQPSGFAVFDGPYFVVHDNRSDQIRLYRSGGARVDLRRGQQIVNETVFSASAGLEGLVAASDGQWIYTYGLDGNDPNVVRIRLADGQVEKHVAARSYHINGCCFSNGEFFAVSSIMDLETKQWRNSFLRSDDGIEFNEVCELYRDDGSPEASMKCIDLVLVHNSAVILQALPTPRLFRVPLISTVGMSGPIEITNAAYLKAVHNPDQLIHLQATVPNVGPPLK